MCLVPILDGVAQAGGCSGVVQPADNVAPMVLPPFIVKGGFLLASILFRVLDGSHYFRSSFFEVESASRTR